VISRRRLHLVIALLLPLLALRALLPAGYMPSADAGGARLVLCSEGLAAWNTPAHDPSQPAHGDAGGECPFAHAAHYAPPVYMTGTVPFVRTTAFVAPIRSNLPASSKPVRQGGARAPPAFL
jgi:hypothetical protein